jgi:predicted nuclease of predicted toxin-antitoxin system
MARKRSKQRVTLYLDEHIDPEIKDLFVGVGYRAIRIQESPFRGEDERDFIGALRSMEAVFVTSDYSFVQYVIEHGIKHGGIWCIPSKLTRNERSTAAAILAGFCMGVPARTMRDFILYFAHDGLHLMDHKDDELAYSYPMMREDFSDFWAEEMKSEDS